MLPFPFDASFQALQPLVLIGDDVFVKSPAASGACVLHTAAGVNHRLEALGRVQDIWKNALEPLLPSALAMLQEELPRRVTELATSPLAYFIDYLEPCFRDRDISEASYQSRPSAPKVKRIDWAVEIAAAAKRIPTPEFLSPAVWVCGRIWNLREESLRGGCWQIVRGQKCYGISGAFCLVGTLISNWRRELAKFVSGIAAEIASQIPVDGDPLLRVASLQVEAEGFVERGDLLFLAGASPRLGHIIPVHYNRTLRRQVNRDLAMTAPLRLPPSPYPNTAELTVYERNARSWSPVSLPHGLCLGPASPSYTQDSPGVGLAAFLRWAAQRIAGNGAFHSSDDADTANDYGY
jgi:hypothetical protein